MNHILKDNFIKNLLKNAAGYTIDKNMLKIFNINDTISEQLIKNRLSFPFKDIKIKNNSLFIKF